MTPAVKAFVELLIDHFETRIADLESQIQKLTPQNSSLPPSTQHPHAKTKRPKLQGKKRGRDSAAGAGQAVPLIFRHDRFDLGKFPDLMTNRLGVDSCQRLAASTTGAGP